MVNWLPNKAPVLCSKAPIANKMELAPTPIHFGWIRPQLSHAIGFYFGKKSEQTVSTKIIKWYAYKTYKDRNWEQRLSKLKTRRR